MTEQEKFEMWFDKNFADYSPTEGMRMAWEACSTQYEARIAELEETLELAKQRLTTTVNQFGRELDIECLEVCTKVLANKE